MRYVDDSWYTGMKEGGYEPPLLANTGTVICRVEEALCDAP